MQRLEIGSEFWNVPLAAEKNKLFSDDTRWFLSGRTALRYILKEIAAQKKIRTAALPSWCCESMVEPFTEVGIKVEFYPVHIGEHSLAQYVQDACDITLVMDYFGYSADNDFSEYKSIVIRDLTHSVFSDIRNDASYYFGSLRKWAGFYTGGFAWKKEPWIWPPELPKEKIGYSKLREDAMSKKAAYINQKENRDKHFLQIFNQAEELLDKERVIAAANDRDVYAAKYLDVNYIRRKRRDNAFTLLEALSEEAIFKHIAPNDCPLFVPIVIKNRDRVQSALSNNNIYCPVHWPGMRAKGTDEELQYIAEHELSIVCDQRYDVHHMKRIIGALKQLGIGKDD